MYQDVSANSVLANASTEEAPSNPRNGRRMSEPGQFSTGAYAERLMDDLFDEVESLLDVSGSAPDNHSINTDSPEAADLEDANLSEEISQQQPLPNTLPQDTVVAADNPASYPAVASWQTMAAYGAEPAIAPTRHKEQIAQPVIYTPLTKEPNRTYDRLLLGVGCVSVVISLALWLLYQETKHRQVAVAPASPQTAATDTEATDSNRQFANYLQKALRNIEQKSSQTASTQLPTTSQNPPGTPTVTIPRNVGGSPPPSRVSTGLERIYVPVYQIPSNLYPPGTPVAPLPTLPKNRAAAPTSTRPNPPQAKPSIPQVKPSPVASAPTVTRKLVGVFDQGDRSAALIETNGVTQRYEIGESVGSSGWTLVDVTKDQAIIRRNGEVRSVFVGHGF